MWVVISILLRDPGFGLWPLLTSCPPRSLSLLTSHISHHCCSHINDSCFSFLTHFSLLHILPLQSCVDPFEQSLPAPPLWYTSFSHHIRLNHCSSSRDVSTCIVAVATLSRRSFDILACACSLLASQPSRVILAVAEGDVNLRALVSELSPLLTTGTNHDQTITCRGFCHQGL